MIKFKIINTLVIAGLLILSSCSKDQNEAATTLYSHAVKELKNIAHKERDSNEKLNSYVQVQEAVDRIFSDYPSSNIAKELLSEKRKIYGLSPKQIKAKINELKPFAKAERSAYHCALMLRDQIEQKRLRALFDAYLVSEYQSLYPQSDAKKLLDQAVKDQVVANSKLLLHSEAIENRDIYSYLINGYVTIGEYDSAKKIGLETEGNFLWLLWPEVIENMAEKSGKGGTFDLYQQLLDKEKEKIYNSPYFLSRIAIYYNRIGQTDVALKFLDDLDKGSAEISSLLSSDYFHILYSAEAYFDVGESNKAEQLTARSKKLISHYRYDDNQRLMMLHDYLKTVDEKEFVVGLLDEAVERDKTKNDLKFFLGYSMLYSKCGRKQEALALMPDVRKYYIEEGYELDLTLEERKNPELEDAVLVNMSIAYSNAGAYKKALQIVNEMITPYYRALALINIAADSSLEKVNLKKDEHRILAQIVRSFQEQI